MTPPVPLAMQIIGLTGGIGTGKSTSCRLLKRIDPNIIIIDADVLSHEAVRPGDCFDSITGELVRSKLAEMIFAPNPKGRSLKKLVEKCIHPWVIYKIITKIIWYWLCGEIRIILDIPLLFETKLQRICTRTVLIDIKDSKSQLKRILKRNPEMTEEEARNRIKSQFPMEMKRKLANHVIQNDGSVEELEMELLKEFKKPDTFIHFYFYLLLPIFIVIMMVVFLL